MSNRRPTTQDISWFLDLNTNGQLDLDPSYQRRSVWTPKDRQFFLDTVFRDYPCPAVFLHKSNDGGKQIYHIVDGKQRIETILMFVQNKIAISKEYGDERYNGKKWKQLDGDQRRQFWDYILTVEMLNTIDGTIVNEVFARLNRNSRRLEAQELRHAKFDGWLVSLAESEAERIEWIRLGISTTARAKRMKDVQFISELLLVILDRKVVGFDQEYLDNMYALYDSPGDNISGFDEEYVHSRIRDVRDYILEMDSHNECISRWAKGFGNFYSLWSAIVLTDGEMPPPQQAAEQYDAFMQKVSLIDSLEVAPDLEQAAPGEQDAISYHRNSIGASTEFPQREARTAALQGALFK